MTWPMKARADMSLARPGRGTSGPSTQLLIAIFLVAFLFPAQVLGQTDNWLGGTGLWSDSTKWSTRVPGPTSNVFIDHGLAGASSVTVNFNGAQCGNLTIDGDDSLVMVDGTIFTLYGPTISNSGRILLNSAGFGVYFNFSGAVTLGGAGLLTMSNNSHNYLMGYAQPSPGSSLTNKGIIQGAGNIGFTGGIGSGNSFMNQGTVNANQTNIGFLQGTITNNGSMNTEWRQGQIAGLIGDPANADPAGRRPMRLLLIGRGVFSSSCRITGNQK